MENITIVSAYIFCVSYTKKSLKLFLNKSVCVTCDIVCLYFISSVHVCLFTGDIYQKKVWFDEESI